jgi:hypothetical protein
MHFHPPYQACNNPPVSTWPDARITRTETFIPTSLEANGAWTISRTFTIRRNANGEIAGNGGRTSSSPANLYVEMRGLVSGFPDISNRIQISAMGN